jgi:hypothetical protein
VNVLLDDEHSSFSEPSQCCLPAVPVSRELSGPRDEKPWMIELVLGGLKEGKGKRVDSGEKVDPRYSSLLYVCRVADRANEKHKALSAHQLRGHAAHNFHHPRDAFTRNIIG